MSETQTLDYYNNNAEAFANQTVAVDFTVTQNKFLQMLQPGARILDFGCGSGRDTKYFLEKGYQVDAIDGSEELCRYASQYTGITVKQLLFQELSVKEYYDGIWACSSILHLSIPELIDVMNRISDALVSGGFLYTSFKYGSFTGERNGRYFTDLDEEGFAKLMEKVQGMTLAKQWITTDVRPGRGEEKWLNVLVRKS